MNEPLICSVGTTEPWNVAGLGLDIRALAACGARAVCVVAGVSAQDRNGVRAASPIAPDLIAAQFAALGSAPIAAVRIDLIPLVTVVTPNLNEAARFADVEPADATPDAMARWGRGLVAAGAQSVLVTGGHLAGDPVDVLSDAAGDVRYTAPRLPGELRGTGCLLACALAAGLARGEPLRDAIVAARTFVRLRFCAAIDIAGMRAAY